MKSCRQQFQEVGEGCENYQLLLDKLSEIQQEMQKHRKSLVDQRVTERLLKQMNTVLEVIKLYPYKGEQP